MKKISAILLFLLTCISFSKAQSSKLSLKTKQANTFYQQLSKATLVVPITDSKDPEEKALITALKKYWTICPYKTISRKEFNEMESNHAQISTDVFYLIRETYPWLKPRKKDWAYTKYFISTQYQWVEEHKQPYIEFKLPLKAINRAPAELPCGYLFDLMMKHFNNELLLMKNTEAYEQAFSRKQLLRVNFKHSLKAYRNKKLLITKNELENYMMNVPDDERDVEEQQVKFIKSISKLTKMKKENIVLVSPDEVKKAVDKSDSTNLIYTGYTIYNTKNAIILRRIDPHRRARPYYWITAIALSAAVVYVASRLVAL